MAYIVDYSGDWQFVDGVETGVVQPMNPPNAPITGVAMRQADFTMKDLVQLGGGGGGSLQIEPTDILLVLWPATLNGYVPKNGDFVTDGTGEKFVVLTLLRRPDKAQWIATCRAYKQ